MGEPRYRVRNTLTGKSMAVPLSAYQDFVSARAPGSDRYIWEAMSSVPGTKKLINGETEVATIPKEQVREATYEGSSYRIWKGRGDPAIEIARQDMVRSGRRETIKDRPGTSVLLDSFLSQVTLGGTSAIANYMSGDTEKDRYAAELRADTLADKPFSHLTGRALGLLLQGMLPIPGVGAVSKAFGIKNVSTAFELGAAASTATRSLFAGKTLKAAFARRWFGATAYGAAAELPLSFALASADLVDHNQPYTWETVAAAGMQQYMWANAITAAWSLPFAGAATILQGAGRGAFNAAAKPATGGLFDSAVRGPARYFTRRYLRGQYGGAGDIAEMQISKQAGKFVKEAQRNQSETAIGRFLFGDEGVSFLRRERTVAASIDNVAASRTTQELREHLRVLGHNVHGDEALAADITRFDKLAPQVVKARMAANEMVAQGEALADDALNLTYRMRKAPKGSPNMLMGKVDVHTELGGHYRLAAEKLPKGHPMKPVLEAKAAARQGAYPKALDDAVNLRMQVPKGPAREAVSKGVFRVTNPENADVVQKMFNKMDEVERAARAMKEAAPTIRVKEGVKVVEGLEEYRRNLNAVQGNLRSFAYRKSNALANVDEVMNKWFTDKGTKQPYFNIDTKIDDLAADFALLGEVNALTNRLRTDARPIFAAKQPMTQAEILGAQVETVINTKRRTGEAFKYIIAKGGGIRHTTTFEGVMAFRSMATMEDKRAAFALHREALLATAGTPEALQENVGQATGPAAMFDMEAGMNLAVTLAAGNLYLMKQLPRSDDPMIGPDDFSGAEIENWLEAVGAIMEPISVLATAADGSTSSQGVDAFRTVYPELYLDTLIDVGEFVQEWGHLLGHAQMMGLDTFAGGALHYTDAPGPALSFRQPGYQTTQQAASAGAVGGPEHRRLDIQQNTTAAQKVGGL